MIKQFYLLLLIYLLFPLIANAQVMSQTEKEDFQKKCERMARTFCGYIEEITEENSDNKNMSPKEFFQTELCQWNIQMMRDFFAKDILDKGKVIGYTHQRQGQISVRYTSIETYIRMLLRQRQKYRTVRYDFSAFKVSNLKEKIDKGGKKYYEGEVKFSQNYYASKNGLGGSELGWDVFHEDFKKLTFKIQSITTEDGRFFYITFYKLLIDTEAY